MASVRNLRLGSIAVAVGLLALLAAGAALAAPRIAGPQAEITSGPPDELFIRPGGTTAATWEFTANQPGARFTCKFTGFKVHPCHSPFTVSGLGRGRYRFTVYASNLNLSPDTTRARDEIRVAKRQSG
jgi:hypothetical protein